MKSGRDLPDDLLGALNTFLGACKNRYYAEAEKEMLLETLPVTETELRDYETRINRIAQKYIELAREHKKDINQSTKMTDSVKLSSDTKAISPSNN